MEEGQRAAINCNLESLVESTVCNEEFLKFFTRKGILTVPECGRIIKNTSAEKFYELIHAKPDFFPVLIEALLETGQHGVLAILEKELREEGQEMPVHVSTDAEAFGYADTNTNQKFLAEALRKSLQIKTGAEQIDASPSLLTRSASAVHGLQAGTSNEENGPIHPLLNEHILDNVFKYIVHQADPDGLVKDVQNSRLVCKSWKDSVTRLYRRIRSPIRFGSRSIMNMRKLLDTMQNSSLIPVQNFIIDGDFFGYPNSTELFEDYLSICGPEAVGISLDLCALTPDTKAFNLRAPPDLDLMRLTTLRLSFQDFREAHVKDNWMGDCNPSLSLAHSITVVLAAAQILREFTFDMYLYGDKHAVKDYAFYRQFQEIVCGDIPKSVKVLKLHVVLTETTLQHLIGNGTCLEELDFMLNAELGSHIVHKFLESQAATLKKLQISICSPKPLNTFEFPALNELLHLKLKQIEIEPFAFTEIFPKLQLLDIANWQCEKIVREVFLSPSKKKKTAIPTVTELHLPHYMELAPHISYLSAYFSMVTKLDIWPFEDFEKTVQEVFVHFCNIESLHIGIPISYTNVDTIFSGVPKSDCDDIAAFCMDDVDLKQFQRKPSILNLKKLKKLVINTRSFSRCLLTDFSAHFLFLRMGGLEELQLSRSKSQLTPKYIKLLEQKLLLKLVDGDDEFIPFNLRDLLFGQEIHIPILDDLDLDG